jgi:chemotaxis protein methyltransferase CheR
MKAGLTEVAAIVRRETGMVVKEAQFPALAAAVQRVAPGLGPVGLAAQLGQGRSRDPLLARLVDEVTIQETYFFRELRDLQAIPWWRLLEAARESGSGVVRIWVAACATGEEAWSLAMLASEALGRSPAPVSILGTDVSGAALARAAAGEGYSERSVRNLTPALRQRYLVREGSHYRVGEELKSLVRFRRHNLVTESSPPPGEVPFDVVACRNVLIYFDPPTVQKVMRALERSLRIDGHLVLGAADRLGGSVDGRPAAGTAPDGRQGRGPRTAGRRLRRPLGLPAETGDDENRVDPPSVAERRGDDRVGMALAAADDGDLDRAIALVEGLLAEDALLADAYFVRGLVELESEDPRAAVVSLRRCLYIDPSFGLGAFALGRAHEAVGDGRAARRAYEQALRSLDPQDGRHQAILDQIDLADVAAACAARLRDTGRAER